MEYFLKDALMICMLFIYILTSVNSLSLSLSLSLSISHVGSLSLFLSSLLTHVLAHSLFTCSHLFTRSYTLTHSLSLLTLIHSLTFHVYRLRKRSQRCLCWRDNLWTPSSRLQSRRWRMTISRANWRGYKMNWAPVRQLLEDKRHPRVVGVASSAGKTSKRKKSKEKKKALTYLLTYGVFLLSIHNKRTRCEQRRQECPSRGS